MCFDSKLEREKKFVVCLMFYLMDIFKWAYLSIFLNIMVLCYWINKIKTIDC